MKNLQRYPIKPTRRYFKHPLRLDDAEVHDDPLGPAKGILTGVGLSVAFIGLVWVVGLYGIPFLAHILAG